MRLILQRVRAASVSVGGETLSQIGHGLLVFVGVETGDSAWEVERAADRLSALRIFDDEEGRMNLDGEAAGAAYLVVSQFTLAASLTRGRRPSFAGAADPEVAKTLIEALIEKLRRGGHPVESGRFGARMEVALVNDGPVTFVLDVQRPAVADS